MPRNGLDQIQRVLLRFKLDAGLYLTITPRTNASTYLPVNEPVPLLGLLARSGQGRFKGYELRSR